MLIILVSMKRGLKDVVPASHSGYLAQVSMKRGLKDP
jgi:hypothetical protein